MQAKQSVTQVNFNLPRVFPNFGKHVKKVAYSNVRPLQALGVSGRIDNFGLMRALTMIIYVK